MTKDYTDSFLDDLEKAKVQQFVDDEVMREAVRKVLLAWIYQQGTLKKRKKADTLNNFVLGFVSNNRTLTDAEIGSGVRAIWEGLNALEAGFSNLAKYKREEPPKPKGLNQAR